MDGKIGKRDLYCAGLEIAFYTMIVLTAIFFLVAMLQILAAEERQRLVVWPLAVTVGASLFSLGCCWIIQGKMLKECGRRR